MAKIKLELEGKIYDLQTAYYSSYSPPQPDYDGKTISNIAVSGSIKSTKIDQNLLDWFLYVNSGIKDGKISIYNDDNESNIKVITFQRGYCSSFSESHDLRDDNSYQFASFSIVSEKVSVKMISAEKRNPSSQS